MAYKKIKLALDSVLTDKTKIVEIGQTITEVTILKIPTGVTINIAFGDGELFAIQDYFSAQPRGDDEQNRGLYWSNPVAQPGVTVEVLVSFGGSVNASGKP